MTDLAQNALAAKRVGQYLIDAGVLTASQLDEALDRQRRMSKAGFHVLLGTILEEMGAIDRQSLEAIILRQRLDEGSVSLGPDVDWSRFRHQTGNGAPAGAGFDDAGGFSPPLSPEQAAETMDAFFGQSNGGTSHASTDETEPVAEAAVQESEPESVIAAESDATPAQSAASFVPLESGASPSVETSDENASRDSDKPRREDAPSRFPFFGRRQSPAPAPEAEVVSVESPPEQTDEAEPAAFSPWDAGKAVASGDVNPVELERPVADVAVWAPVPAPVVSSWDMNPPVEEPPAQQLVEAAVVTPTVDEAAVQQPVEAKASESVDEPVAVEPPADEPDSATTTADLSAPVDILGFKFSHSPSGLSASEVSAVIGQLTRRTRTLEEQVAEAKDTLSHLDSMRRYGEQSVKAADTIAQQIREEAEEQALAIRDRAQQEARNIVSEARSKHDEIVRAAGDKAVEVGAEIARGIDEHRALNDTFMARARAVAETDTSGED